MGAAVVAAPVAVAAAAPRFLDPKGPKANIFRGFWTRRAKKTTCLKAFGPEGHKRQYFQGFWARKTQKPTSFNVVGPEGPKSHYFLRFFHSAVAEARNTNENCSKKILAIVPVHTKSSILIFV